MTSSAAEQEYAAILKQIADIAAVAGVRGDVDLAAGAFVVRFGFDDGRDHQVFVRPSGRVAGGRIVVTFQSLAFEYQKKKFLAAISQKDLLDLLVKNEMLTFARFGIVEQDERYLVVVSVDHLLETLDGPEFMLAANSVAKAADGYEVAKGVDRF